MGYTGPNAMLNEIARLEAENARLRVVLEKATEKLQIFRCQTDGQYVGGIEYSALMREIAEAVAVEQKAADCGKE